MSQPLDIARLAAFTEDGRGGNPAGVAIGAAFPPDVEMQRIAAELGYSETAFLVPQGTGWRVRYFAPEQEVPFCGHATIALAARLGELHGAGRYRLILNDAEIEVEADAAGARLVSPPSHSRPAPPSLVADTMADFGLAPSDLDPRLPPALAHAGADHLVLALKNRERLAAMDYPFETVRDRMRDAGLITISLLWIETPRLFHARNAFAAGGVVEDPATGAAAAALGGYLRDIGWPHGGRLIIRQGQDMGVPSRLTVEIGPEKGSGLAVSGAVRRIAET